MNDASDDHSPNPLRYPPAMTLSDPVPDEPLAASRQHVSLPFAASFFLFGTINNILYVVILSAALDLIGNGPKGIILFVNIAPALLVKVGWPYLVRVIFPYPLRIKRLLRLIDDRDEYDTRDESMDAPCLASLAFWFVLPPINHLWALSDSSKDGCVLGFALCAVDWHRYRFVFERSRRNDLPTIVDRVRTV